jgi:hypothetical protein
MTDEQLLLEIFAAVEMAQKKVGDATRRLEEVVNRVGVSEQLLRLLRSGPIEGAQMAAIGLVHARSELVRKAIQREVRTATGERRLAALGALTPEELEKALTAGGLQPEDLVEGAGLIALNDPGGFIELVCEGTRMVGLPTVDYVERVRQSFNIEAASLYGPLLDRPLTPKARHRILSILGRESGPEIQTILERAHSRADNDDDRRVVRRERMRQATVSIESTTTPIDGAAVLLPPEDLGTISLEIVERTGGGKTLWSTARFSTFQKAQHVTVGADADAMTLLRRVSRRPGFAQVTLGQARWLLESLPATRRHDLKLALHRLRAVPSEPIVFPALDVTHPPLDWDALIIEPAWSGWRPLRNVLKLRDEAIDQAAKTPLQKFPGSLAMLKESIQHGVPALLKHRGMATNLALCTRHLALSMHLSGDPRAAAVAAEAVRLPRGRRSGLVQALGERELWRKLWEQTPLPQPWREELRTRLRATIHGEPNWEHVARLDLAQAFIEGGVREERSLQSTPGLPAVASLALDEIERVTTNAVRVLRDPHIRKRIKAGRFDTLTPSLFEASPDAGGAITQLARFARSTCFTSCPHRCLEKKPRASAEACFRSDLLPPG